MITYILAEALFVLQKLMSQIREDFDSKLRFDSFQSSGIPASHKMVRSNDLFVIASGSHSRCSSVFIILLTISNSIFESLKWLTF